MLNVDYSLEEEEYSELFDEQNKFMYSVFERTLLTDQGKSIVIKYENDSDAQEVYKDFLNYHTSSVKAYLIFSSQLSFLIITKIDERKGTDEGFILHWQDKLRIYEATVPSTKKYPCVMKKSCKKML